MKPKISLACKKTQRFPPVQTEETKKEIKQRTLSFIKLKQTFPSSQNYKKFKLRKK